MKKKLALAALLLHAAAHAQTYTPLSLPSMFADHMVLQQQTKARIWGWGNAGSTVRLVGSWATADTISAQTDNLGRWSAALPTGRAGGPYTLAVFCGADRIELTDVMLGEVWLCSGQSNMEWTPDNGLTDGAREIAAADCPDIRFFHVPKKASPTLQDDCGGTWEVCTPQSMRQRSAVAYFFARHLRDSLRVPVGVMTSAWGGTIAEVWIPAPQLQQLPGSSLWPKPARYPWWPDAPGVAYNRMIHPLLRYNFAGAIWYQGESNREYPHNYALLLETLIASWRHEAGRAFPFYAVQIAPHQYKSTDNGPALIREAQAEVMRRVPGCGLAVISDCVDNLADIHPINKRPVGHRLALLALSRHYRTLQGTCESPFLLNAQVHDRQMVLTFSHAEGGLICRGKQVQGLTLAGPDGRFVPAEGRIDRQNRLIVTAPGVRNPVAARYCFDDATVGNLFNREGFPVAPFRTDR